MIFDPGAAEKCDKKGCDRKFSYILYTHRKKESLVLCKKHLMEIITLEQSKK